MSDDSHPAFWPHIKWVDSKGQVRDIGVKLDIQFVEEPVPDKQEVESQGIPSDLEKLESVEKNPWDNVFAFATIDALTPMSYFDVKSFWERNKLTNIEFTEDNNKVDIVKYTPPDGTVTTFDSNQLFEIKQAIRSEWARQNPKNPVVSLKNNILGQGNLEEVKVDPLKSAPEKSDPYQNYKKFPSLDRNDYYSSVEHMFKEQKQESFSPEERNKMLANVIIHEIGHNIGMAHTDFGVMNESSEEIQYEAKQVSMGAFKNESISGTTLMKQGTSSIQGMEVSISIADASILHNNIQKLVNRIPIMTAQIKARNINTGVLEDVSGLWNTKLKVLLDALHEKNKDYRFGTYFF